MATFAVDVGNATYEVDAPDENTAWKWANATHGQSAGGTAGSEPFVKKSWSDVPMNALSNLPSSAANFAGGIYQSLRHPIDTASTIGSALIGAGENLGGGLVNKAVGLVNPELVAFNEKTTTPTKQQQIANQIGQFYKDRYGGIENLKNTISTDPVGVAADASTILAGGAGLASKANLEPIANVLQSVSNYTNPVNAVIAGAKGAGNSAGFVGRNALGLTTGVGSENISNALKSGYEGNGSFWKNLTGDVSTSDVLDRAKAALQNMRLNRSTDYKTGMTATTADTTPLNFQPIDDALNNVVSSMKSNGHWKIGDAEISKLDDVSNIVKEWRDDPTSHTASGLDALKQRLDAVYPDSPIHNQAQRAITTVRNAVKDTIVNQSPEYASTMDAYESAISLENEIKRALSLGNKASADTAMRKLQSLARNNVNTNYGSRLELAKALEEGGGVDLMPAISGQAMNSWTARGLGGQAEQIATIGASVLHNPLLAMLLPFQSPKAVGATLYGIGKAAKGAENLIPKVLTPQQAKIAGLLLSQSGKLPQQ